MITKERTNERWSVRANKRMIERKDRSDEFLKISTYVSIQSRFTGQAFIIIYQVQLILIVEAQTLYLYLLRIR